MATVKSGTLIAEVRSRSDCSKTYNVRMLSDAGFVCDCLAYRFTKGMVGKKPPCKHIVEVVSNIYKKTIGTEFSVTVSAKPETYKAAMDKDPVLRRAIDY